MRPTLLSVALESVDRIKVRADDGCGPNIKLGELSIWLSWDQLEALSDKALKLLQQKPLPLQAAE